MLQKALTDKGHKVYIVTVNPENMSYKYDEDDSVIRIPGIPVGIYDYRLTGIYPIRAINKIKKYWVFLEKFLEIYCYIAIVLLK